MAVELDFGPGVLVEATKPINQLLDDEPEFMETYITEGDGEKPLEDDNDDLDLDDLVDILIERSSLEKYSSILMLS
ncbi:hypothetical protein GOP47_0007313 [Adiantum capillus-veneris]|uniref:Uncharacterized protein n=1 Tax=Adiantum capillus-veneris TaxID=13818 RepID=A0A9D4V0N3_ADICA|nr:hypothetical protein GOP47_0007313 [Adiantum capillus-veneris]